MMASAGRRSFAGQELRLADIEADAGQNMGIFESLHTLNSPADLADHLKAASRSNYGVVLHAHLTKLVAEMNDPEKRAARLSWVNECQNHFMQAALPPSASGQVHRVAKRFALAAAGGELGTYYGLTGWKIGEATAAALQCFNSWLDRRGTAGQGEIAQLLAQVSGFFEQYGEARFSSMDSKSRAPVANRVGFRRNTTSGIDMEDTRTEYFVLPAMFKGELVKGFDPRWAARVLIEKKIMTPGNDGRTQIVQRLPGLGPTRCYHFSAKLEAQE